MRLARRARVFVANPFRRAVHVCFKDELISYSNKFLRWHGARTRDVKDDDAATFQIPADGGGHIILVVLPREYKPDVVWHESLHVCTYLFQEHCIPVSADNDEILAYMQCFIQQNIAAKLYGKE
jgi:hypothetical protein